MTEEARSARQQTQLTNARQRYPVDDLTPALADLGYEFGTFMDWPTGPEADRDPREFDRADPDHPYAIRNRQRRQEAASFFSMLAEGDASLMTDEALAALHRALFDCTAAVRYDVAMALGHLNRPQSAPFLERLIATEPRSAGVRAVAQWAHSGHADTRYGSPIVGTATSAFRQPCESDMVRDDNHISVISSSDVFHLLWSACSWEHKARVETEVVRRNFEELCRPGFSFQTGVGGEPQHLSTSRLRAYLEDLQQRIETHHLNPPTVADIHARVRSILHYFRVIGYHDQYAGQEGGIRQRLFGMLDQAGFTDPEATTTPDGEIRSFAAYYFAFTDSCLRGVPRMLHEETPMDIRAFLSHSSTDKECARRLADALQQEAIKVWLDERELRIGDSLWDEIGAGIDDSTFLLILISPRSVASTWVRRELNAGLSNEIAAGRKIVLPIVAERTELPVFLRERLYCDLSAGFDEGVAALVRAMN
jgi:hypothetical protein